MTRPEELIPPPITIQARQEDLETLLGKEWLQTNRLGAYSSSTVAACNTRRYHGLLVAPTQPPVGRIVTVSQLMEELVVDDSSYPLSTNEFDEAFEPRGVMHLEAFRNDLAATYVFAADGAELTKEILLAEAANAVAVRYRLSGVARAQLRIRPLAALRDFHHLRQFTRPNQMTFERVQDGVLVRDVSGGPGVCLTLPGHHWEGSPDWWYRFLYRTDLARGQDCHEDLYAPGWMVIDLAEGQDVQLTISLGEPVKVDFEHQLGRKRQRLGRLVAAAGESTDATTRRLVVATDAFIVNRSVMGKPPSATILAGYHWFADWGRDTFIALPGLLLATGQHERALQALRTFGEAISEGMIPNRFDDYSDAAHYNSIDASLWFVLACERYLEATQDQDVWQNHLLPACDSILRHYHDGTRFDIHADADALLTGGSEKTQLTWMDAKLGDEAVTPRHGKAVEINALWYCAHRILAERCRDREPDLAAHYGELADRIGPSFVRAFWNEEQNCLYDCITHGHPDGSIRPNQVLAVSVPYSPLSLDKQKRVVQVVTDHLLTPVGLRSLSPFDPRYRRRYGGSWESRDRAYHQGTVWGWLMGPFIEAHLKAAEYKPFAVEQAKRWLDEIEPHLSEAGLGYVSEIFDGDPPHTPKGCIAQAWSVAEMLRARRLVRRYLDRT